MSPHLSRPSPAPLPCVFGTRTIERQIASHIALTCLCVAAAAHPGPHMARGSRPHQGHRAPQPQRVAQCTALWPTRPSGIHRPTVLIGTHTEYHHPWLLHPAHPQPVVAGVPRTPTGYQSPRHGRRYDRVSRTPWSCRAWQQPTGAATLTTNARCCTVLPPSAQRGTPAAALAGKDLCSP